MRRGNGATAGPTPLEQAQALREVLVSAIDLLGPASETVRPLEPKVLQHHILQEEYELQRSTRQIMTHLDISESTLHRNRRDAVDAVARQLETQEALIARGRAQG